MARRTLLALALAALTATPAAHAEKPLAGGTQYVAPPSPGTITPDGLAVAPPGAPADVRRIIAAGNRIARTPYRYGGGHRRFKDTAYDCSGSVSFALRGARLLRAPLDSTGLMSWGRAGEGDWVTVYARGDHAYLVVAGLRFDTSGRRAAGSRWQLAPRDPKGFTARHPAGL